MKPEHIEIAEQIARDASCAQGEFNQRVLSIIPYLTDVCDRASLVGVERPEDMARAMLNERESAFNKWWKLSTHNGTLPEHRHNLAREAYYAAWGGGSALPCPQGREEIAREVIARKLAEWDTDFEAERCADAIVEALTEADAILSRTAGQEWREPEGWQLVPKELTEDMAAEIECSDGTDEGWQRALASCPPLPAPPVAAGKSQ